MKFAHAHAARKMKNEIVISFFFNARGESLEKSTVGMYRSLLLQLLEQCPRLQVVFDSLGRSGEPRQWSIELLKELLEQAVRCLGNSSVLCFIDALDECDETQIREMIPFFEHMGDLITSAKDSLPGLLFKSAPPSHFASERTQFGPRRARRP